jgi:hypothetical protein
LWGTTKRLQDVNNEIITPKFVRMPRIILQYPVGDAPEKTKGRAGHSESRPAQPSLMSRFYFQAE